MKGANADAGPQPTNDSHKSSTAAGKAQTSSAAASGSDTQELQSKDQVKLEMDDKERQRHVDEDLVRAFRYFDKTGKG